MTGSDSSSTRPPTQERALLELAVRTSDPSMTADQYRYVLTRAWWMGSAATPTGLLHHLSEHVVHQWIPALPEREWVLHRELTGRRTWLSGSEDEARAEGVDLVGAVPTGWFRAAHGDFDAETGQARRPRRAGWHTPTPVFLARLPRDPEALLGRLRGDGPEGRFSGPFSRAVDALRTGIVPADLRAALYQALCLLPAVSVDEAAADPGGAPCVSLVHDSGPTRTELFVDPEDGQFAGERDTLRVDSRLGLAAGTVISSTTVRVRVVDEPGTPAAP